MPTFTQIGSAVVVGSGGQASIDFTSIPSTYTDLQINWILRTNNDPDAGNYGLVAIAFNGSTSNITRRNILGTGSSALSQNATNAQIAIDGLNNTASTFANGMIYLPNYAGSTNKSASSDNIMEQNSTAAFSALNAILWSQTAAINQITLSAVSGSFVQYSTAYLYGVSNA